MKSIVIFASGSGTNAENIIRYFQDSEKARVSLVLSNKKEAKVLDRARELHVSAMSFNREAMSNGVVTALLSALQPDLIVLAGYLWKIPESLIHEFEGRIINIHPALLPAYGGKGMYGMNVHKAVIEDRQKESGITIHYVNEHYDEGGIIFQARTAIETKDDAECLAGKIHQLEYTHYPRIIENLLDEK
ncbi:phosphoribosylglycinamide formyltransferase [Robertkochia marina]|uniref:Phosphoribosylglycinamide formyltransferase n=1 Tax=Robertkochia marina TaxID=1227945 RepID=A0A4S3M4J4_9FLAO|nr:phosphoribosylglycinamide formyltransferase [Robertkochia marina]THD69107.1 phosphoribosylglycinamide formyltransferase [Robertkochia marina]TRZ47634.1 phosphoribosylglycinamide formyltransferase [Robertkochia marina]